MDEWRLESSGRGLAGLRGIWSFVPYWVLIAGFLSSGFLIGFCAHNWMPGINLDLALRGFSVQYTYTCSLKADQYKCSLDFQFNNRFQYLPLHSENLNCTRAARNYEDRPP